MNFFYTSRNGAGHAHWALALVGIIFEVKYHSHITPSLGTHEMPNSAPVGQVVFLRFTINDQGSYKQNILERAIKSRSLLYFTYN